MAGRCPYPFEWPGPAEQPKEFAGLHDQAALEVELPSGDTAWLVTRYRDVRALLTDPRISKNRNRPDMARMTPPTGAPKKHFGNQVEMDPPGHPRMRRSVRIGRRRRSEIARREIRLEDSRGLAFGIAAVEHACRAQRGAVHGFGQLRLDQVGPAGIDGEPGEEQQQGGHDRHVNKNEALLPGAFARPEIRHAVFEKRAPGVELVRLVVFDVTFLVALHAPQIIRKIAVIRRV